MVSASGSRSEHPLEGRWIVFDYRECDREEEVSALAVYQMKRGTLVSRVCPASLFSPSDCNGENVFDRETKRYVSPAEHIALGLKRSGVGEVVSIWRGENSFGVPMGHQEHEDDPDQWHEYTMVEPEGDMGLALQRAGVGLRIFRDETQEFVDWD